MLGYVRANPIIVTLPLDTALDITQFLQQAPQGSLITSITIVHVDSGVSLSMAYGQQLPKTVFQGQCFTFGGIGECIGVMDLGLSFGTSGVAVAGGTVQLELCFFSGVNGGSSSAVASQ